jgi:hypothetical protein
VIRQALRGARTVLAKNDDNLAGSFETDNSAGLLSGLLAEEDEFDRRALWRLGSWGVGAVAAVIVAVMANQSQLSLRREQIAAADLTRQAQQVQMLARESQSEARRLASAIDTLNGDRDRLYSRVSTLEQGLDSVTGAIARQGSGTAASSVSAAKPSATTETAAQNPPPPAPAVTPVATTQAAAEKPVAVNKPPSTVVAEASPPATSTVSKDNAKPGSVKPASAKPDSAKPDSAAPDNSRSESAKTDAAKPDSPVVDAAKADTKADTKPDGTKPDAVKADTAKADTAKPDTAKTDITQADTTKADSSKTDNAKSQVPSPSMPLVASKSIMAPPDQAATKLVEPSNLAGPVTAAPIPEVVATAPAADEAEAEEAAGPKVAVQRTEFGVDLGSANSVNGLRALWRGLLKSRANAPLAALRPIIVVKEATNGLGMQLRLVAGPLNDASTAARICATMTENKRPCETTIFDGQRLSIKADDTPPPAAATPAPRRRGYAKRAAAPVVVEEPKKPEPTTISSWFGRRGQ